MLGYGPVDWWWSGYDLRGGQLATGMRHLELGWVVR
jgi:hypothetical protein